MAPLSTFLSFAAALCVSAEQLTVDSNTDIKSAAQPLASQLVGFFKGGLSSGALPPPYWWWESAGAIDTLIHYSHYTEDYQYDSDVATGILAQAGNRSPYFMGPNALGNDDQLWWGLVSMSAAEYNFKPTKKSYLTYAEDVWNQVLSRWDTSTCGGGLRWQLSNTTTGYNYKNGISNGLFFQLSARLGRYTGNSTYTDQATTVWNWTESVGLIDKSNYNVYDGTYADQDCSQVNHQLYSYNVGVFLYGAAFVLDVTGDSNTWQSRLSGLVSAIGSSFSNNNVLQESICEPGDTCNNDQLSFKGYVSRWLAEASVMIPSVADQVKPILDASVRGALASCNDGNNQNQCGFKWTIDGYDDTKGVGQQLAALELVHGQLAGSRPLPSKANASKRRAARSFVT